MIGLSVLENFFGIQDGERPYFKNNKNRNLKIKKSSFLRDSSSYRYDIRKDDDLNPIGFRTFEFLGDRL